MKALQKTASGTRYGDRSLSKERVSKPDRNAVFLNIPYDVNFQGLYLAYITGLAALGLEPRLTLSIPGGERRLDRIIDLISSCRYSIHDMSRVELSPSMPMTPRFNMPFELGLTVAWGKQSPGLHTWHVFESVNRRLQKSLSDLDGTDAYIHAGKPEGVMRELCNAFVRTRNMPKVPDMLTNYHRLIPIAEDIQRTAGAESLFEARIFRDVYFAATTFAADL